MKYIVLLLLLGVNLQAQTVFPTPATDISPLSLAIPPSSSPNQCIMWNGTVWNYIDWDTYGLTLFNAWDHNESDDFDGTWASLTGKPSLFAPSAHTHTIAEVTGLQTALDAKQDNFVSQSANLIFASPSGSAGVPVFRTLTSTDIPTLNQNTTGTASNITGTTNSTLTTLPNLLIATANIPDETVTSADIANATIVSGDIASNTVANSNLTNMPALSLKGAVTAGAPVDLTFVQAQTVLGEQVATLGAGVPTATNNTTTLTAIAGMSFPAIAGQSYKVELHGMFTSTATTSGIGLVLSTPAGTVFGMVQNQSSNTALSSHGQIASNTIAGAANGTTGVPAANTNINVRGEWVYNCTTSGTVTLNMRSEIASSTVVLQPGAKLIAKRI